jgi:hypothetical protein
VRTETSRKKGREEEKKKKKKMTKQTPSNLFEKEGCGRMQEEKERAEGKGEKKKEKGIQLGSCLLDEDSWCVHSGHVKKLLTYHMWHIKNF